MLSKIYDTSFKNDFIKENTGRKILYIKIAFLYFASQCESIFTSMHKSNINLKRFPRYDVVNPVKLIFMQEKIFLHYFYWKS